jgi:23S rRNA pseudouridine2605 synthase
MISKERKQRTQVSLARAISKLGIASRAEATRMIRQGRVQVNGRTVRDPGLWLDPRVDRISQQGSAVKSRERIYLALHKPAGFVTTRSDERGRRTVYDLLPPGFPWVFPVGRLDKETSGLLLLTNDTKFGEAATNPERKVEKMYKVFLDHPLSEQDKQAMGAGMTLSDGTSLPGAVIRPVGGTAGYEIGIKEGKNRQIRRMCESLGYEVQTLHRVSIGAILLGDLKEGKYRSLSIQERASILPEH